MDKQLEEMITNILTFTELAIPDPNEKLLDGMEDYEVKRGLKGMKKRNIFPISYIGAVEPFMDPWMDGDGRIFFRDATPHDVNGKWDVSIIQEPDESWGDAALFQLSRCRRKPLHEIRGKRILGEYANETSAAVIKQDGSYISARTTHFYVGKTANGHGRWAAEDYSGFLIKRDAEYGDIAALSRRVVEVEEDSERINVALGAEFNRDYDWTVTISVRDIGNPVLLTTDSVGAQVMFNDREATTDRRAALEHWVKHHWRKCRADPDSELFVRQHLRGVEQFIWKGFECVLRPSPYDLRLAQKLKVQREEMKREGKTMRLRANNASVV